MARGFADKETEGGEGAMSKEERLIHLQDYTKIIVETDEENPVTIAEITSEEINTADGYRVRMTPKYD